MVAAFELGDKKFTLNLPPETSILKMKGSPRLENPPAAIKYCLDNPVGTSSLSQIIKERKKENPQAKAVIVISDNTRPVPYKGEQGILLPLVNKLIEGGVSRSDITILCANGTHLPLPQSVFKEMIDPEIFRLGISIINHDCLDKENLDFLGFSKSGTKIEINKIYTGAHIKILTGLVESHFMAGVSGGRKSICPGLIGEDSTFIFHGVQNLDDLNSRDLVLDGNPCHEEAVDVALRVGADFILNVTLDHEFNVTGYFAGDMIKAHLAAYDKVKASVGIETSEKFDIVISHAGFVGKNHYQAAKTGIAAIPLLKKDGYLIIGADCTDSDPIGKESYKKALTYLLDRDSEEFIELLKSSDWTFIPDQWQVQMWAKLFRVIPQNHLIYYAPQIEEGQYDQLPGQKGLSYLPEELRILHGEDSSIPLFLESALKEIITKLQREGIDNPSIAWLADGPYGIVIS